MSRTLPSNLDQYAARIAAAFIVIAALGVGFVGGATYRAGLSVRDYQDARYYQAEAHRLRYARDRCMAVATYSTAYAELVQGMVTVWLGEVERAEAVEELVEVGDR